MENNVERINKGKGGKFVLLMFAILAMGSLAGCSPEVAHATPTDTIPVATTTAKLTNTPNSIPTNTPNPTPTNTPKPTPIPELTLEQKKALLGINENFESSELGSLIIFEVSFGNITGRIWGFTYVQAEDPSKRDFYSLTNGEYLFTLNFKNKITYIDEYARYLENYNENLKNLKLINSVTLVVMANYYDALGISYNGCEELKDLNAKYNKNPDVIMNTIISEEQILDLYIRSTPQEKLIPFWVYTPGAKIPDELKGIYSEKDYPPAPPLPETIVQQSNRIYDGYAKEFTSKDGATSISYPFERVSQKEVVDDNVVHGYKNPGYYNSTYAVTGINHSNQYTKTKI